MVKNRDNIKKVIITHSGNDIDFVLPKFKVIKNIILFYSVVLTVTWSNFSLQTLYLLFIRTGEYYNAIVFISRSIAGICNIFQGKRMCKTRFTRRWTNVTVAKEGWRCPEVIRRLHRMQMNLWRVTQLKICISPTPFLTPCYCHTTLCHAMTCSTLICPVQIRVHHICTSIIHLICTLTIVSWHFSALIQDLTMDCSFLHYISHLNTSCFYTQT